MHEMEHGHGIEYIQKGDTGNPFRFFNMNDISACYKFYEEFARGIINVLQPEINPYNQKDIKQLNFTYKWDNHVNAGALEREYDIITVNEGTIIKIYGFFYRLVNRVSPFPPLAGELKPHVLIENRITFDNSQFPQISISEELVLSDDPRRNNLAEFLSMFAIKWIIAHEIGHVYNGHTKYYLETRNKIKQLDPIKDSEELKQCYLDLQTMEMDADTFASNRIMEEALALHDTCKSLDLQNPLDFLKLPVFAIHGVFYIFRDYRTKDSFNREHPPTFIRESMSMGAAKAALESHGIYKTDDFFTSDIGKLDQMICYAYKSNNDRFIDYVKTFGYDAAEWAELLKENYFERVSHIIKAESRLPIEGIDY